MSPSFGTIEAADIPVTALLYQDVSGPHHADALHREHGKTPSPADSNTTLGHGSATEIDLEAAIAQARAEAAREAEERLSHVYEQKLLAAKGPVVTAVAGFIEQRNEYFARVEAEVVQLALAIARKILHRESQVDPMLVAALVRIAIDRLHDGSSITVRVPPAKAASWKSYFAGQGAASRAQVVGDPALSDLDCMLETELGTANFGLDSQLKEVEQGFFDLLALRPVNS